MITLNMLVAGEASLEHRSERCFGNPFVPPINNYVQYDWLDLLIRGSQFQAGRPVGDGRILGLQVIPEAL